MTITTRIFPRIAFIFNFLFILATSAIAQQPPDDFKTFNPRFEVFELPGEIPGNQVQCIVQDSTGFLWSGSQTGLRAGGFRFIKKD